jgi:aryl-alcohol dehydrogenase-like predicted oxidoreductase
MITGKATVDGTIRHGQFHSKVAYQPLFPGGPVVSQAGFGTYRTINGFEVHEQALHYALKQGINLIDTSSNYGDGEAERLIGKVITQAIGYGELRREELIVISKGGYIQGGNLDLVQQRKQAGNPFPNVVKYAEGLDHCIHPEFLADQITRSLERLQMDCIDGYLLHNPEYYLMWASKWQRPVAESRQIYYQRIQLAFAYLEEEVSQGRIQWYGISSNTFPSAARDLAFTSLETAWEIANSISANHHFRIIQLPMNLMETGAVTEKNQSRKRSVLEFAREKGLGVLINRPLNAIHGDSLTRLADMVPPSYPTTPMEVSTAVDTLVESELEFQQTILPTLEVSLQEQRSLLEQLALGRILQGQWRGFGSYQNWLDIQSRYLLPRVRNALQSLSNQPNSPPEATVWQERYVDSADIALTAVSAFYQEGAFNHVQIIKERIAQAQEAWVAGTLSQTAVRAVRSTDGISSVLIGMRRQIYVDDVLADLSESIEQKEWDEAWERLRQTM